MGWKSHSETENYINKETLVNFVSTQVKMFFMSKITSDETGRKYLTLSQEDTPKSN